MWKVFNNGDQTSPTSTLRKHFRREHPNIWKLECRRLKVPQGSARGQMSESIVEPLTRDSFMRQLQEFIIGDDLVRP